jgi:L-lactate dehydrogenase complex protein LldF
MIQDSVHFLEKADIALANPELQARNKLLGKLLPAMRDSAIEQLGNFEELRAHVKTVKDHTLDNLDHYLRKFESRVEERGGQVHWARDAAELNELVLSICQRVEAREVAKGKSMVTEETGLTEHLQAAGLRVTETDLGEYIIQIAEEPPSHIVGPAFHKSEQDIRELFLAQHPLGQRELPDADALVQEARGILRERFLSADVGIIGANALIAESGHTMLVTNEGNGDLVSTLPRVHIVCAGIEKLLPRYEDATALQRLLVRSATGAPATAYTSFYKGPRRDDDIDGPEEFHVVLLDNRRSEILASDYREMLRCMRCAACLNHCPVYIAAGGHAYGWVYPGPMGSVLTPLLTSLEESSDLPNACTSCGRCAEVCPADIALPDLLRDLRAEENQRKLSPRRWRIGLKVHSLLCRLPRLYHLTSRLAIWILHLLGHRNGALTSLGLRNGWTDVRDFPAPQGGTFMAQYRKLNKERDSE